MICVLLISVLSLSGTRYSYSNFGYSVLGQVVERVTGRRYELFVRDLMRKIGVYRIKLINQRQNEPDIFEVSRFLTLNPTSSSLATGFVDVTLRMFKRSVCRKCKSLS